MSVYTPASVTDQPDARLSRWRVYAVPYQSGVTHHFVGYNHVTGDGRVSSPIIEYDPVTKRGVTRSGRRYELLDEPGTNMDAEYVFGVWLRSNRLDSKDATDVSEQYVTKGNLMQNSRRRYKPSPLQVWKEQYKFIADLIRKQKNTKDAAWGKFKRGRNQSRVEFLRDQARALLASRDAAATEARRLYAENRPDRAV